MILNSRLFNHYGIDTTKNLNIRNHCPRPFDTILIDKNGSCYACECTSWLPQSVGNLQIKTLDEIVCSPMHEHLQESILDKSYRYCNENQCPYILSNTVEHTNTDVTYIDHLRLAIDDSCNLRCPSCRTGLIFYKEGSQYKKRIQLADKINAWLQNLIHQCTVHIGSDGDPFASHVYRYFMKHTPDSDQIRYSILTNGLMFEEFHPRIPHIIKNLTKLGVSIDGASKETYEKLRLGGKWDSINRNLEYIANLKQKYGFKFVLHFIVQKNNYHEMEKIIDLGKKYNADHVWLNKLENWNTFNNFAEENVIDPTHKEHAQYQKMLEELKQRAKKLPKNFIEAPTLF